MKIYTRSGDDGTSGLIGGERVSKADARLVAIGEIDELNATIGWALLACHSSSPFNRLAAIQNQLFDLGAEVASGGDSRFLANQLDANELEREIDEMDEELVPLKNFILPGGCEAAARIHIARAVCRRAERALVSARESYVLRSEPIIFVNRLSDWLFALARLANARSDVQDVVWKRS